MADIIMPPKPGKDNSQPRNHFYLLPNVFKVTEQVILAGLRDGILELAPIPDPARADLSVDPG